MAMLTRRDFLTKSGLGVVALSIAGRLPSVVTAEKERGAAESTVVLIRHSRVVDGEGRIQQPLLQEMLDEAVTTLTGKRGIADAWRHFFSPEDMIGLKVNANSAGMLQGTELNAHYPALTSAILSGCQRAGIEESRFVIWERSEEELSNAGFKVQTDPGKVRVLGTNRRRREAGGIGFSKESFPVGDESTHVSRIVTEICTAMINIPILKDHGLAGITGSLKNHYGTIDNPRQFHDSACTGPGVPEINAISVIREKERLIVCDALLGVYEGGPRWRRPYIWPYGGVIVGTDPVAVDSVLLQLLDEKRRSEDMETLGHRARHIRAAEQLGLGTAQSDRIQLVRKELG
jgi:uncharacterized protein (DUF362 family)